MHASSPVSSSNRNASRYMRPSKNRQARQTAGSINPNRTAAAPIAGGDRFFMDRACLSTTIFS